MTIVLTAFHKGGDHTLEHDLNFQSERYEAKHTVVSRNGTIEQGMFVLTNDRPSEILNQIFSPYLPNQGLLATQTASAARPMLPRRKAVGTRMYAMPAFLPGLKLH